MSVLLQVTHLRDDFGSAANGTLHTDTSLSTIVAECAAGTGPFYAGGPDNPYHEFVIYKKVNDVPLYTWDAVIQTLDANYPNQAKLTCTLRGGIAPPPPSFVSPLLKWLRYLFNLPTSPSSDTVNITVVLVNPGGLDEQQAWADDIVVDIGS